MNQAPLVIKVGGNDLAAADFVSALAQAVAALSRKQPCVLVHGGGRAVSELMARLGVEPVFVAGQRVTDEAALEAVEMLLSGRANTQLTLALLEAGVDALGLSGVDRGLLRVEPWSEQMGRVGRIKAVRAQVLLELCAAGVTPVVSPVSIGPGGRYNVNADHAAGAIAGAIGAARAVFLTDVPGVMAGAELTPRLTRAEAQEMIAAGAIVGGMIPKVNSALAALAQGVPQVVITDLAGLRAGAGTVFTRDNAPAI